MHIHKNKKVALGLTRVIHGSSLEARRTTWSHGFPCWMSPYGCESTKIKTNNKKKLGTKRHPNSQALVAMSCKSDSSEK